MNKYWIFRGELYDEKDATEEVRKHGRLLYLADSVDTVIDEVKRLLGQV